MIGREVAVSREKNRKCEGTSRGLGTNHVKPLEARVLSTRDGNREHDKYGVISLHRKVNEGAVVELIRRRYSQNKTYVSNILAARAGFLSNNC